MVVTGSEKPSGGTVTLGETSLAGIHPRDRIAAEIAYIPADRNRRALVGPMRCDENLLLGRTTRVTRRHPNAAEQMEKWSVRSMP